MGRHSEDDLELGILRLCVIGKLILQSVKKIVDRKSYNLWAHNAGFDLINIEQRVQHA